MSESSVLALTSAVFSALRPVVLTNMAELAAVVDLPHLSNCDVISTNT